METVSTKLHPSLKKQLIKTFAQMIADLDSPKEIETFLTDFFGEEELETYIKRIAVAYWLKKGRDTENIKRNLLATPKEIDLAKNLLKKEGVELAIKYIEAEEFANVWAEKIKKFTKT
jgi:uncharacterized protein YerC